MKTILFMSYKIDISLYLVLLFLLTGCNNDVFIENFLPEKPKEITLSESEPAKEMDFKAKNWRLFSVMTQAEDGSFHDVSANAYTLEGKPRHMPLDEEQTGIVSYADDFIDFKVEKRSATNLKFVLNENLMNENSEFYIAVGNNYKTEVIKLSLTPTNKYRIDSVVYDWSKFKIHDGVIEETESFVINNEQSAVAVTTTVYPFKKAKRKVLFYNATRYQWNEEMFKKLLGIPLPQITLPDIADSNPVLLDTKVPFGIEEQQIEITSVNKELAKDITIDAHDKRQISVLIDIQKYSVPYKVYISNPGTGKKRVFSGELMSSCPTNDYFILKKEMQ